MALELTPQDREDAELAVRVQKGDRDAFPVLVARFQGRIFNFTYQFFRDRETAAEITQETFLRVFRFIRRYNPERKFSTWIYAIAKNVSIDHQRRSDRGRTISLEDLPPGEENWPEGAGHAKDPCSLNIDREEKVLLEEAISRLPEKYRMAVVLCYFEELSYQEVAQVLDLSLSLVKVRIFRAKKMLLELLKRKSPGQGL